MKEGIEIFSDSSLNQQPELLLKEKDWDVRNTSTSDGCGCKTNSCQRSDSGVCQHHGQCS
eukprot:1077989-Amphidinium_carterae.1